MSRAGQRRAGAHAGRRRRRSGGSYVLLGLVFVALLGVIVFTVRPGGWPRTGTASAADSRSQGRSPGSVSAAPVTSPSAVSSTSPSAPASTSASPSSSTTPPVTPSATATTSPPATTSPTVPKSGTGVFATALASGAAAGHGDIRHYKVEVEGGAGISAASAAHEIQSILANPRGWTADGHDGFQLVSSGTVDFVIKIATPDTTDAICGAAGLHTHGEVNCDVGPTVVVNLKRWLLGSPEFDGPVVDYRALIINHEVGHRIGHGHETCPGPGMLAPVMMQQIDGLKGCKANQWPYDAEGHYIQGPSVP
ncbi:DUF3152 domain-containing protein [Actinacidiphila yeochonensis]|uniref:DUF3152 domain-containing protein n=1 Tax=Actinacidiphila yeochonensis TaxID=89050 RepID=UPI000568CC90|nr:DUF3152 domain-containing protein [Actinacidiphila yeochonensis]